MVFYLNVVEYDKCEVTSLPARMSTNFFIFFRHPNADPDHRILNFYRRLKQPLALIGRYGKFCIGEQLETSPLPRPILLDSCEIRYS